MRATCCVSLPTFAPCCGWRRSRDGATRTSADSSAAAKVPLAYAERAVAGSCEIVWKARCAMSDDLYDALVRLAERGSRAGASTVVERALAQVDPALFVVSKPPDTPRWKRPVSRLATSIGVAIALVLTLAGGGVLYLRHKLEHVRRVDVTAALSADGAVAADG